MADATISRSGEPEDGCSQDPSITIPVEAKKGRCTLEKAVKTSERELALFVELLVGDECSPDIVPRIRTYSVRAMAPDAYAEVEITSLGTKAPTDSVRAVEGLPTAVILSQETRVKCLHSEVQCSDCEFERGMLSAGVNHNRLGWLAQVIGLPDDRMDPMGTLEPVNRWDGVIRVEYPGCLMRDDVPRAPPLPAKTCAPAGSFHTWRSECGFTLQTQQVSSDDHDVVRAKYYEGTLADAIDVYGTGYDRRVVIIIPHQTLECDPRRRTKPTATPFAQPQSTEPEPQQPAAAAPSPLFSAVASLPLTLD